ncbi:MAG: hypothetical protein CM1200mP3_16310 [Chloroflexota bacterium]|nr:MAG: hypothetical protein CM1200mP3_16310 [Chloroflexota bacterium]
MLWLEIDMYQPESLRQIRIKPTTRICTGENLFYMRDYLLISNSILLICYDDVPWKVLEIEKIWGSC